MKFTVELESCTKIVEADRVKMEDGSLNFYNVRYAAINIGGSLQQVSLEIVGSFRDYKNFYIEGDDQKVESYLLKKQD